MVSLVTGPVTKLGLRRDIKYFLAMLVGYFTIFILALLLLFQKSLLDNEERTLQQWNAAADLAAELLERKGPGGNTDLQGEINTLQRRFGIGSLRILRPDGTSLNSDTQESRQDLWITTRSSPVGRIEVGYNDSALRGERRRFAQTASICIAGTIAGTILLLLFLPRIVRPIELLMDQASQLGEKAAGVDEAHYLIETFRGSIDRLKTQELELKRLHDLEKTRADELERITATLTRSLSSGFIAVNGGGIVVDVNSAGAEILKIPPGTAAGKTLPEILGDGALAQTLESAIADRATLARREVAHRTGGEERVIGLTTVPLFGEEEDFLGMIVLFTDLTHIRHLESRLQETQTLAALGEISAGIAHEFRNSLSTILGYLKLARRCELPPDAVQRIQHAQDEAGLLSSAVEGLLNFARPMHLTEFHPVKIRELTSTIIERLKIAHPAIGVVITGDEIEVEGDRALLSRAVENLLRNAFEAVVEKGNQGEVMISLFRTPRPGFSISDNGVGLDPEKAPRLFLPFQSDKAGGFGLGLALTKKILLLHDATVHLDGIPGQGAVATVEFSIGSSTPLMQVQSVRR